MTSDSLTSRDDDRRARLEEALNCATHGAGAVLSLAALVVLVTLASLSGGARHIVTVAVFGTTLLLVYLASTLYHACRDERRRCKLKIFDHAAIYALIAGTYTPFLVVLVRGGWGWSLFGVLWALAAAGVVFKLFCTGRFQVLSTLLYIAMGWIGLIALRPLVQALPGEALALIIGGGVAYTLGAVVYMLNRIPFNHAIWHLFVLAGSALHFAAVLRHVVP